MKRANDIRAQYQLAMDEEGILLEPQVIRCDNGPEYISGALLAWAEHRSPRVLSSDLCSQLLASSWRRLQRIRQRERSSVRDDLRRDKARH